MSFVEHPDGDNHRDDDKTLDSCIEKIAAEHIVHEHQRQQQCDRHQHEQYLRRLCPYDYTSVGIDLTKFLHSLHSHYECCTGKVIISRGSSHHHTAKNYT